MAKDTEGFIDGHTPLSDIYGHPQLDPLTEQRLAQRALRGDQEAVSLLVCSHLPLLYKFASCYYASHKDHFKYNAVMDLFQELAARATVATRYYDGSTRFQTYLRQLVKNEVRRRSRPYMRSHKATPYGEDLPVTSSETSLPDEFDTLVGVHNDDGLEGLIDVEEYRDTQAVLQRAIKTLTPHEQEFLDMRYTQRLSMTAISDIRGYSNARTPYQINCYILAKLRAMLGAHKAVLHGRDIPQVTYKKSVLMLEKQRIKLPTFRATA